MGEEVEGDNSLALEIIDSSISLDFMTTYGYALVFCNPDSITWISHKRKSILVGAESWSASTSWRCPHNNCERIVDSMCVAHVER